MVVKIAKQQLLQQKQQKQTKTRIKIIQEKKTEVLPGFYEDENKIAVVLFQQRSYHDYFDRERVGTSGWVVVVVVVVVVVGITGFRRG